MVRSFLRGAREKALVAAGSSRRARARSPGHLSILAYHNIISDREKPAGDRSLHLRLSEFRKQLDLLVEHFDFVELKRAHTLGAIRERPAVAITFDDAYWGALKLGIPELFARRIPVTVFVCPGLLGGEGFWWDRLSSPENGMDPEVRREVLETYQGIQERSLAHFSPGRIPDSLRPAQIEELDEASGFPNVSLASHTWAHPNLARLGLEGIADQLETSRSWLRERYPESVLQKHISFPYGLFDDRVIRTAQEMGFEHFYRIEGGRSELPLSAPYILPRLNIPAGISIRGFELRASGVLG